MQHRPLGSTGLFVSRLAFGAGPVSALMTAADGERQHAVVRRAVDAGINWFDTAATYGEGRSEESLGAAFEELGVRDRVHVATKARILPDQVDDVRGAILASFEASLKRLRLPRVTLLQLHNSVTARRGDEPTSITPHDVLGAGGVLETFAELQRAGLVEHLGLTGIGQPAALREVIRSGRFQAIQLPYNVLNPSAGRPMPAGFVETDFGNIIADCAAEGMAVFPIRVFAGGALAGRPPSAHTLKTKFFPLDLYERDVQRAGRLRTMLAGKHSADRTDRSGGGSSGGTSIEQFSLRFALSHPQVTAAIVGFGSPEEVDAAAGWAAAGELSENLLKIADDSLIDGAGHASD